MAASFEAPLDDGRGITRELFDTLFDEEIGLLAGSPATSPKPRDLFRDMVVADDLTEFLTLPAYELLD